MTYSLDGVPFDHPEFGWVHRATSKPLADLRTQGVSFSRPGRNGVVSAGASTLTEQLVTHVIRTPREHLRALESVVRRGGLLTSTYEPGAAWVEFKSASLEGSGPADTWVDVAVVFGVPDAVARGPETTSAPAVFGPGSTPVTGLFPGLTADVQDAIVRIRGAASGLQIADWGSGSWFSFAGSLTATQFLRFESNTGRAWLTTTDVWVGGTEVSGLIDFGGPRGVFEISPTWASTDPTTRWGELLVSAGATSENPHVRVRGSAAYLI